jgi:lipopolysaccharide biosynthesis glycosyltransferase
MINICYACNSVFINYLSVSLLSVLNSKLNTTKIHIYILHSDISIEIQEKLYNLINTDLNVNITFLQLDYLQSLNNYPKSFSYDHSIYFRLEIFNFLHHLDKVLYLDVDTLIMNDLTALYNENMQNFYAAVVSELPKNNRHFARIFNNEYSKKELELKYFNSGVLLINIKKVIEDRILNNIPYIFEKYGANFVFDDQDLLNILWYNNVKYLLGRYHIFYMFYDNIFLMPKAYRDTITHEIKHMVIAHFNVDKPDSLYCIHLAQKAWLTLSLKSPFVKINIIKLYCLILLYYIKKLFFIMINREHFRIKIIKLVININPKKLLPVCYYKTKTHNILIILGLKLSIRRKVKYERLN